MTITIVVLVASMLLTLLFLWARKSDFDGFRRRSGTSFINVGAIADDIPSSTHPIEGKLSTGADQSRHKTTDTAIQARVLHRTSPIPSAFTTIAPIMDTAAPELQFILAAMNEATQAIDEILKKRRYQIHAHGASIWLTAEERSRSTIWRIFPHGTNGVVGSVEAVVFEDAAMRQRDDVRSFEAQFDLDGTLRKFWWKDKHEIFRNHTDRSCVEYARRLEGETWLNVRRDYAGNVLSSNVYDPKNGS